MGTFDYLNMRLNGCQFHVDLCAHKEEGLRAFDIVYTINKGTNGLELISALVVQNLVGEGQVIGVGSALAVMLLVVSLIPITIYLSRTFSKDA
jgi:ABC-type sugar transport system permease subunit